MVVAFMRVYVPNVGKYFYNRIQLLIDDYQATALINKYRKSSSRFMTV